MNGGQTRQHLLGIAALLLVAPPAMAQTFSVPAHVVAGGGTSSSGGGYTLTGTVGEAAAGGALAAGPYSVIGGFWYAAGVSVHVPFTDPILTSGVSPIRAVHISELRQRINAVRAQVGLAAYLWTDPTLTAGVTTAKAVHVTDLRTALSQAYLAAGRPAPTYTTPGPAAGTAIRAVDITELRAAVVAIE